MLDLVWIAQFKDGSGIKQFDDLEHQSGEHAFKEVLDRQHELQKFALVNISTGAVYVADLINGTLCSTTKGLGESVADPDMLSDGGSRYRLIYFRRVYRDFGLDLAALGEPRVEFFLGFQYNDAEGKNYKRLAKIDSAGRFIVN